MLSGSQAEKIHLDGVVPSEQLHELVRGGPESGSVNSRGCEGRSYPGTDLDSDMSKVPCPEHRAMARVNSLVTVHSLPQPTDRVFILMLGSQTLHSGDVRSITGSPWWEGPLRYISEVTLASLPKTT